MTGSDPLDVLFDVSHPRHVHLFKHAIESLDRSGHRTVVTSREKGVTTDLLDAAGIDHRPISGHRFSAARLLPEWIVREYRLVDIACEVEPDVVVSGFSPPAVHAAHLSGARSLVFTDDERAIEAAGQVTLPFTTCVCTPESFGRDLGPTHRRYRGYQGLAYLRPDRFDPDPEVLRTNGVDPNGRFFVLRFRSAAAHEDTETGGFSPAARADLVEFLDRHGDVYLVTDETVPDGFAAQPRPVPADDVHHLLAFADLYAGDTRTMALEAGLLGTPSVRAAPTGSGRVCGQFRNLDSRYSVVLSFDAEDEAVVTAKNLATDPLATERWVERRAQLLDDTIDVTEFVVEAIRQQGDSRREPIRKSPEREPSYELA